MKIKLLLIEDNRLLRKKITEMLKPYKDILIDAISSDSKDLIADSAEFLPHVILLNIALYNRNSMELVEDLKNEIPDSGIIVTSIAATEKIMLYIKAGATGFIMQEAAAKEFLSAIRTVSKGISFLPPVLARSLFSQIVANTDASIKEESKGTSVTTKREQEVIELLSEGMSNKEISQRIGISTYTVKSHIHNIMEKLTLHTRLEIANFSHNGEK